MQDYGYRGRLFSGHLRVAAVGEAKIVAPQASKVGFSSRFTLLPGLPLVLIASPVGPWRCWACWVIRVPAWG